MRKIKLTVEYDGTDFAGFQTQASGIRTVQVTLGQAIEQITSEQVVIHAAGRTDAGVHALGQVVHFRTETPLAAERLLGALNALLPRDVSVRDARDVDDEFHARFSARRRAYLYLVLNRPERSAIWDRYSLHEPRALDVLLMQSAARRLAGTHDYGAFANAGGDPGSTLVRRVERLQIRPTRNGELLMIVASANGFLRSMVRNIVGALIAAGRGALTPDEIEQILQTRDRTQNPCHTVSARGLCLYKVDYDVTTREGDAGESAAVADEEG